MNEEREADLPEIRREAAQWLAKQDRGLTGSEQDAFLQWLSANPQHGEWLSRHREGWRRLDAIAEWRPEDSAEPNPDVLARSVRQQSWFRPALLATAAGLLGLLAVHAWRVPEFRRASPVAHVLLPPTPGGFERRVLDDGSIVQLNRGAEIEVNFSAKLRRVSLRNGEAHFTVQKDPDRPFVVRARGVDVRAVGTAFNVRLELDSIEVLVTEGRVQLAPPAMAANESPVTLAPPIVAAGERAVISLSAPAVPQIARTLAIDLARLQAWQPQLLDFSSTPLADVIAEFNTRNRMQIVLEEPGFGDVPIVASIRSDNIDGFVRLLALQTKLRAEVRGDYQIVLRARL